MIFSLGMNSVLQILEYYGDESTSLMTSLIKRIKANIE